MIRDRFPPGARGNDSKRGMQKKGMTEKGMIKK